MARLDQVVALRLPSEVLKVLRAAAREDDRPLSAFLRRTLTAVAEKESTSDAATR